MISAPLLAEALEALDKVHYCFEYDLRFYKGPKHFHPMQLHVCSTEAWITFLDVTIWSSEEDDRKWSNSKYEPLGPFLIKKCNAHLKALRKVNMIALPKK